MAEELSPERVERRAEIKRLTQHADDLYKQISDNSTTRAKLIVEELEAEPKVPAREVAEAVGLTVARIYALRDKVKKA